MDTSNNQNISNNVDTGKLQIYVTSRGSLVPVPNATISISYTGEPDNIIERVNTDSSGTTEVISLSAPPLEYSLSPGLNQPYSEYNLRIDSPDFDSELISAVQILPTQLGIQDVSLQPGLDTNPYDPLVISPHTLYYKYPPKIAEEEIKPMAETGEIVLTGVVIPEYIIVHDGAPTDTTATNHYVRYKDYIKNVASSEIYATWPANTIRANVLAIMSFTLNRVFTEWYRNKGYNFTITSSTAYDHKWIEGKTIYNSIAEVVDEVFSNFLSRPNVLQPILTQYCDGQRVTCPKWMSQWGSKNLGDSGYSTIDIIRYYYGNDMYINTAQTVSGVPASWPGYNLTIGSSGDSVRQIQSQLNRIAQNYPLLPTIAVDGIFGQNTANAVRTFQKIFNMPQTGIVDYPTWYRISDIYTGVSRIAELV